MDEASEMSTDESDHEDEEGDVMRRIAPGAGAAPERPHPPRGLAHIRSAGQPSGSMPNLPLSQGRTGM
ncbi:hypothetical protein KUCAC02_024539 [Chaenocephalus aceratus]|uniref:Uncharacterized protein n=1 Tax=Chaenocephalus aceratus TaxID=36190 RepID=A0ACB9WJ28_CHAAC|nr:hypothetical protein KUCAC02_024539 [Chaenocephalus aceratus]